jgi:hypothetical protein
VYPNSGLVFMALDWLRVLLYGCWLLAIWHHIHTAGDDKVIHEARQCVQKVMSQSWF